MKQLQEILKPHFTEGQTEIDITAVLKYIASKWYYPYIDKLLWENTGTAIIIADEYDNFEYTIPSKPLHLYTEQEEKELLEILNNLK